MERGLISVIILNYNNGDYITDSIYEKKYGTGYLISTAVEDEMNNAFKEALKQFKGTPIIKPSVGIEKADLDGVKYIFTIYKSAQNDLPV